MLEICSYCEGDGHEYMLPSKPCQWCQGKGSWEASYWYFTFGFGHEHKNRYVKLIGTRETARNKMMARFGTKWAMQYDEATFLPQITKYSLTELV
jgi:hypothetical protein